MLALAVFGAWVVSPRDSIRQQIRAKVALGMTVPQIEEALSLSRGSLTLASGDVYAYECELATPRALSVFRSEERVTLVFDRTQRLSGGWFEWGNVLFEDGMEEELAFTNTTYDYLRAQAAAAFRGSWQNAL